jgi:hypothetical protein
MAVTDAALAAYLSQLMQDLLLRDMQAVCVLLGLPKGGRKDVVEGRLRAALLVRVPAVPVPSAHPVCRPCVKPAAGADCCARAGVASHAPTDTYSLPPDSPACLCCALAFPRLAARGAPTHVPRHCHQSDQVARRRGQLFGPLHPYSAAKWEQHGYDWGGGTGAGVILIQRRNHRGYRLSIIFCCDRRARAAYSSRLALRVRAAGEQLRRCASMRHAGMRRRIPLRLHTMAAGAAIGRAWQAAAAATLALRAVPRRHHDALVRRACCGGQPGADECHRMGRAAAGGFHVDMAVPRDAAHARRLGQAERAPRVPAGQ